jgi:hypothetical protein
MTKYRYVIVCSNGASYDMQREEPFSSYGLGSTPTYDLPELLRRGWQPLRETPLGGVGEGYAAYALAVLTRDDEAVPVARAVEK